jgi:hypothetical protein
MAGSEGWKEKERKKEIAGLSTREEATKAKQTAFASSRATSDYKTRKEKS